MSLFEDASLVVTPNGRKASKIYSIKPTDGSGDLTVVRATTKTEANSSGVIVDVPINVPSFDYTNSSCPSILVEPQRTNLILRSEEFNTTNWAKTNVTVTANNTTAPDGNLTADLITATATNGYLYPTNTNIFSSAGGTARAYSVFLKAGTATSVRLIIATASVSQNFSSTFNLSLGTATADTSNTTVFIVNYGNGWYRCTISATIASASYSELQLGRIANGLNFYAWGAQVEAGSYATSYIPTTSASVTRNADVISKTGISSLIGQTEGTVLCDINLTKLSEAKTLFIIDNGTTNEYIALIRVSSNIFRLTIKKTGTSAVNIINSAVINNSICKIAIAYKNGDYAMYINGVLRGTSTNSTDYPTTALTQFILSNASYGFLNDSYNSAAIWKERLSNEQLATLTTI